MNVRCSLGCHAWLISLLSFIVHSLCKIYNLNPEDLKFKWEAFSINMGSIVTPTVELVRQLKSTLQSEFQQKLQTKARSVPANQTLKSGGIPFSIPMEEDSGADILGAL
ncbi:hypothetical protein CLU79DRAFT_729703 [Phycomyces nitens]|nr:hypothetical protein CLU79DRAFT_729703 [Phycomyces nitens]